MKNTIVRKYYIRKVTEKGYTYAINYPYSGSIVPNCIYKKEVNGKVISIIIEVNKRINLA